MVLVFVCVCGCLDVVIIVCVNIIRCLICRYSSKHKKVKEKKLEIRCEKVK